MDDKYINALDKVIKLAEQNKEFGEELRKRLELSSVALLSFSDKKIEEIYEYCIEKIIRKQATEFYADFPLKSLIPMLIEDYVRMESFRRKDQFGDFCLSLYQQIECITNKLCESKSLSSIAEKMWGCPAYVKSGKDIEPRIDNRVDGSTFTIASLLLTGQDKKTGLPNSFVKSKLVLQNHYAMDKVKVIVYYIGFRAAMKNSDYDNYIEITSSINDVYQCRNMNHRGNTQTQWEEKTLERILPLKSYYYFKFLGVLAQYVNIIRVGYDAIPEIEEYANSIPSIKVSPKTPTVLGKIDLPADNKKRFK